MSAFAKTQPNEQKLPEMIYKHSILEDQLPHFKKTTSITKSLNQFKQTGTKNISIPEVISATVSFGILSLPLTVSRLGIMPFLVSVCLAALLNYAGFYFIISVQSQKRSETYAEMVGDSLSPNMKKLSKIILTIKNWTQTIIVQIMFIKFTVQLLHDCLGLPLYEDRNLQLYSSQGHAFCAIVGVLMIVINIKLLMMTNLGDVIDTIGRVSLLGILFCLLIVVCTCFSGFTRPFTEEDLVYKSVFKIEGQLVQNWKQMSWDYFKTFSQGTSLIFFVLFFHQYYFPLFKDSERSNKEERNKDTIRWTVVSYAFIFIVFGLLGYFLLVQHSDVLPIPSLVISSIPTLPVTVAKVFLIISLLVKLPIPAFVTKESIYEISGIQRTYENQIKLNVAIGLSTIAIATTFQKITCYFSIFGGTLGIAIAIVIPLLCAKNILKFNTSEKALVIFTIIMSLICLFGSITQAIQHL